MGTAATRQTAEEPIHTRVIYWWPALPRLCRDNGALTPKFDEELRRLSTPTPTQVHLIADWINNYSRGPDTDRHDSEGELQLRYVCCHHSPRPQEVNQCASQLNNTVCNQRILSLWGSPNVHPLWLTGLKAPTNYLTLWDHCAVNTWLHFCACQLNSLHRQSNSPAMYQQSNTKRRRKLAWIFFFLSCKYFHFHVGFGDGDAAQLVERCLSWEVW